MKYILQFNDSSVITHELIKFFVLLLLTSLLTNTDKTKPLGVTAYSYAVGVMSFEITANKLIQQHLLVLLLRSLIVGVIY